MYSYSSKAQLPLVLVQCECGREYLQDEMFCCLHCAYSMCRFCTSNELCAYQCKNCSEVMQIPDSNFCLTTCHSCFECPQCKNVLKSAHENGKYFFKCNYCFYNTKISNIQEINRQNLCNLIMARQKHEMEQQWKEFSLQSLRLRELHKATLQKQVVKTTKTQLFVQKNTRSQSIPRMSLEEIIERHNQKELKVLSDRTSLNIKHPTPLMEYQQVYFKQSQLPQGHGYLMRRNRTCHKCSKMIYKLDQQKDSATNKYKIYETITQYHIGSAPYLQVGKLRYTTKEKNELAVQLLISNRTKFNISLVLYPISDIIIEQFKLLKTNNLPSKVIQVKSEEDATSEVYVTLAHNKIQFAILIKSDIDQGNEISHLNFTTNIYIGNMS